jgi:lipase maturation factor 1
VARLFHSLLALVFLLAWVSLGLQVVPLVGAHGLEPAVDWFARLDAHPGTSFWDAPSLFWLGASDTALTAGCGVGALLALLATLGLAPRVLLPLQAVLYLSYVHAADTFLGFQWDNLLIEAGLLAALLPRDRPARFAHTLFRILLFKVFFESGLAKWESPRGDWQDGSAMGAYYETAPLPTPLAFFAHHMPNVWHSVESWWVLAFELVVPVCAFGGRWLRAAALAVFASFLFINTATANYGYLMPLMAALCVFLLDERHALALLAPLRRGRPFPIGRRPPRLFRWAAGSVGALWLLLSFQSGLARFANVDPLPDVRRQASALRAANSYGLFGAITPRREAPQFETTDDGTSWTPHPLRHMPGPAYRRPPMIAPHQPRLDFQLWFYAMRWERSTPQYVASLVSDLCHAPQRVQSFFPDPLSRRPHAVRIVFFETTFTDPQTRRDTGRWWDRVEVGATRTLPCADVPVRTDLEAKP